MAWPGYVAATAPAVQCQAAVADDYSASARLAANPSTTNAYVVKTAQPGENGGLKFRLSPFGAWSPSSAWLCGAILSIASISAKPAVFWIASRSDAGLLFVTLPEAFFFAVLLGGLVFLWLAVFLSKIRTIKEFWFEFGFNWNMSAYVVLGSGLAGFLLGIGFEYIVRSDAHKQVPGFSSALLLRWLPLLLAPFFEEPIMRGYIYKAFRTRYPALRSTVFVGIVMVASHWPSVSHSVVAGLAVWVMNLLVCALRETTKSLWPSIAAHFFYNLGVAFAASY